MIIIPNPQHGRHAYREPPRHVSAATVRPAELPGHRITLTTAAPLQVAASLPGPADLSLLGRTPVIAVLTPSGFRIVERLRDALHDWAHSLFDATIRRLMRLHAASIAMARQLEERQALLTQRLALLEEHARLEAWRRLPQWAQMAGQTHRRALTQLGPDTVRAAIVARALAASA